MASRDVSDGESHGEDGQAEGTGDTEEAYTESGEACRQNGGTASPEDEPEGSEEFRKCAFAETHGLCLQDLISGY
jgi:hypothetical protein